MCLALNICPHYIWYFGLVARKRGLACLESSHKTFAELSWCFARAGAEQTSWVQKQRNYYWFYHSDGLFPWLEIRILQATLFKECSEQEDEIPSPSDLLKKGPEQPAHRRTCDSANRKTCGQVLQQNNYLDYDFSKSIAGRGFLLLSTVLTCYLSNIPISTPFSRSISTAVSLSFPSILFYLPNFSFSAPPSASFLPSLISSHELLHHQHMASSCCVGRAEEITLVLHLPILAGHFAWPLYSIHYLMFYVNKLQIIQDVDRGGFNFPHPQSLHTHRERY